MKLRIHDASLRLRLAPSEIDRLLSDGRVAAALPLGPSPEAAFTYALEAREIDAPLVDFRAGSLTVGLPLGWVQAWPEEDGGGYDVVLPLEDGRTLHLVVEKDLPCRH